MYVFLYRVEYRWLRAIQICLFCFLQIHISISLLGEKLIAEFHSFCYVLPLMAETLDNMVLKPYYSKVICCGNFIVAVVI